MAEGLEGVGAMNARFRVFGSFDRPTSQQATVTVDRAAGLFSVRPYRSRRAYTVPLAAVAAVVVARLLKAEANERARARHERQAAKRKGRA
jgi:hypothetical protein